MLFNTFQFFYFLAILLPLYWVIPHHAQNVLLLAASYYFYSCWNLKFLTLKKLPLGGFTVKTGDGSTASTADALKFTMFPARLVASRIMLAG